MIHFIKKRDGSGHEKASKSGLAVFEGCSSALRYCPSLGGGSYIIISSVVALIDRPVLVRVTSEKRVKFLPILYVRVGHQTFIADKTGHFQVFSEF
jgi:hypothetical protein